MPIQRIKINSESGIVYSPYTGEPVFVDDDINDTQIRKSGSRYQF